MSSPIRVLVVDDSAFTRKIISDMLNADPDITVVDVARNGAVGVEKARSLKPDVITLDVEMPVMNGLEALEIIMKEIPTPVVMLSALTQEGAATTLEALEMGAVEFVPKPSGSIVLSVDEIRDIVIEKVKLAAKARLRPQRAGYQSEKTKMRRGPLKTTREGLPRRGECSDAVVVIGTSTGGPSALGRVLPVLPADIPAGLLVVQHMPSGFTKSLAARLNDQCQIEVREADEGDGIERGKALVAPGGYHMVVKANGKVRLSNAPLRNGVRPAIDNTMESAADIYGNKLVGVVLTGMGRDGAEGMAAIKASGGKTIAEHESTCVIYGMPKAVIERGLADVIVPLDDVGEAIIRSVDEIE